jgi:hypothetical protein
LTPIWILRDLCKIAKIQKVFCKTAKWLLRREKVTENTYKKAFAIAFQRPSRFFQKVFPPPVLFAILQKHLLPVRFSPIFQVPEKIVFLRKFNKN